MLELVGLIIVICIIAMIVATAVKHRGKIVIFFLVAILAGAIYLAVWPIPVPIR